MTGAARMHRPATGEDLEPVLEVMRRRTGLTLPARTVPVGAVRREMRHAGMPSPAEYARLLALGGESFDALVTALTVGETYFLREREQLDFISRRVLPELARAARGRMVTAWSAGCARGEEAYSLAIIAAAANCPIRVLGTDISSERIELARAGTYGEWSFRGVSAEIRDRYFQRSQDGLEPIPAIRSKAEFRRLNLAGDDWRAAAEFEPLDLILCRNTLIYLDSPTVTRVARRLLAALAPSGWLFLGASDPLLSALVPCEVVLTGAGVAYRRPRPARTDQPGRRVIDLAPPAPARDPHLSERRRHTAGAPPPGRPAARVVPPAPPVHAEGSARDAYEKGDYVATVDRARRQVGLRPGDASGWIFLVRALANLGRLDEAGSACASAHDLHRGSAELAYLHGLLLREGGRVEEAVSALRAAIYLDRQLVIAHLTLGDLLAAQGDMTAAIRAFRNADRLLASVRGDDVVAATDGLQAKTLAQLTSGRIEYWLDRAESTRAARV